MNTQNNSNSVALNVPADLSKKFYFGQQKIILLIISNTFQQ